MGSRIFASCLCNWWRVRRPNSQRCMRHNKQPGVLDTIRSQLRSRKTTVRPSAQILLLIPLLCCSPLSAQNPQLQTKNGRAFPTVVFSHVLWSASPPYYSIAIDSTGDATYESVPAKTVQTGAPYLIEFEADACRRTVFRLIEHTNFLRGEFRNTKRTRRIRTVETLTYRDPHTRNQVTYNSTADPNIRKLTSIFVRTAATLQFGRNLTEIYGSRSPKLGSELARLQTAAKKERLLELRVLRPILTQVVSDQAIDNTLRRRAQAILRLRPSACS